MVIKLNETQIQKVNKMIESNAPITHIANAIGINYKTMKRIVTSRQKHTSS